MKLIIVLLAFSMVYLTDGFVYAPPFHQTARKYPHLHQRPILIEVPWKVLSLRPSEPMIQMVEDYQIQPGPTPTGEPFLRYSKKK